MSTCRGRSATSSTIRCTIQAREWDDTLNAVRQGNADAIIAGLAITSAAREELDFSDVYMRWPGRFVVRRDAAPIDLTPEGLKGKTLAVVARTAHEAYLAAFFPEVGRKLYPTPEAARDALKSGDADAHFGDGMQLSFWLQSEAAEDCCAFAGGPYLEARFFGEGLAIAVPRGQDDLKQAINAALACALREGGLRRALSPLLPGRLLLTGKRDASQHAVADPRAPLDRRHYQLVDLEPVAKHLQEAELLLLDMEVGCGHLDGERIGGFVEARRQRRGDEVEHPVETVIGLEQDAAGFRRRDQAVAVEIGEDGEGLHHVADRLQLAVGHGAVGGRQRHHGVDQRIVLGYGLHCLVHVRGLGLACRHLWLTAPRKASAGAARR